MLYSELNLNIFVKKKNNVGEWWEQSRGLEKGEQSRRRVGGQVTRECLPPNVDLQVPAKGASVEQSQQFIATGSQQEESPCRVSVLLLCLVMVCRPERTEIGDLRMKGSRMHMAGKKCLV